MLAPWLQVGAIIGKGGEVISQLKSVIGVKIRISDRDDFVPGTRNRKVTISGAADAVQIAQVRPAPWGKRPSRPNELQGCPVAPLPCTCCQRTTSTVFGRPIPLMVDAMLWDGQVCSSQTWESPGEHRR